MDGAAHRVARFMLVKADMTERSFNLVVPLSHEDTAMRKTETDCRSAVRSGAVSWLSNRPSDVDSTIDAVGPGIRTSTTVTRTTTPRPASSARGPSADRNANAAFTFMDLVEAYMDCRRTKRNSASALTFELNLESNLRELYDELVDCSYRPGSSICFVVTKPKPREVWAAAFRDRIVHHVLYRHIAPDFERSFIADSCACIKGRGTHYAVHRLEAKVRSITQNWSKPAYYLKLDLSNFFVSIDKRILHGLLEKKLTEPWWLWLTETILFHDPRIDYQYRGNRTLLDRVPSHKRLTNQPVHLGLPIGNLSSQFFANVYLNELDQHAKHIIRASHYVRYVDDMILLHESPDWLNAAHHSIEEFLPRALGAQLNPKKTILQPVDRGIDFVGQVIKPWRTTTRRRVVSDAVKRIATVVPDDFLAVSNSYFGLVGQANASHTDRARIANAVRRRGHAVNKALTKTYRGRND